MGGLSGFKMPLTKKGSKLKNIFEKEYGKKKGDNIFYAYENKHKELKKRGKKWKRKNKQSG